MTAKTVLALPDGQLRELKGAYDRAVLAKRLQLALGAAVLVACIWVGGTISEFSVAKLWANADKLTSYLWRLIHFSNGQFVWTDMREWFWGVLPQYNFKWLGALLDTVLMAYIGTVIGAIAAVLLAPLAAANLNTSKTSLFFAKRTLEFLRTVPELVFAMLFVAAFGIGAFAGIAALALHSAGALGKLSYESMENIDMKTVEGVSSTGGGWWQTYRFAVLPQVLPTLTSYTLWRFEINVRSASIIGFVGAGGIGQNLKEYISKAFYSDISALLVLIVLIVVTIDLIAERLRHYLVRMQVS